MERFNPGDRVECVNPNSQTKRGAVYTVVEDTDDDLFGGRLVDLKEVDSSVFHWRLKLVKVAPPPKPELEVGTFPFLNPGAGRV